MTSLTAWLAALAVSLTVIGAVGINCLTRDMTAWEVLGIDLELDAL